jgi:hypothetical protein
VGKIKIRVMRKMEKLIKRRSKLKIFIIELIAFPNFLMVVSSIAPIFVVTAPVVVVFIWIVSVLVNWTGVGLNERFI